MFRWTDSDVGTVIDVVARCVGIKENVGDKYPQFLQELAELLGAQSWRYGVVEPVAQLEQSPQSGQPQSYEFKLVQPTRTDSMLESWQCSGDLAKRYSHLLPLDRDGTSERSPLAECIVAATECPCRSQNDSHPVIVCLWFHTQNQFQCVEYSRAAGEPLYTDREQALLRVVAHQLEIATDSKLNQGCSVPPPRDLSRRQREVLELLMAGKCSKQIASELQLSIYTVNDYIKAIYRRYDVSCRAELLATVHFGA